MLLAAAILGLVLLQTSASTLSRGLSPEVPITVAMYDFDKTMVTNSFGEVILLECDPSCNYEACTCVGEDQLSNQLTSKADPLAAVVETFGGQERMDRMKSHFETLEAAGVDLYIVSTSWYAVTAEEWAKFIFTTLETAGMDSFFPLDKILTLADPGEGVAADKGQVIRDKLAEIGVAPNQALFADDSEGNFQKAIGNGDVAAETLYVQPRTGLSDEALDYIESRVMGEGSTDETGPFVTSITTGFEAPTAIKVAMYDFDKTLVINSFGEQVLLECDPTCNYDACTCTGDDNLRTQLVDNTEDPMAAVLTTFGGQERLDRVKAHLQAMEDAGIDLYMVSTSWYAVTAAEWANFIYAALEIAGLENFFPLDKILTLDDPGAGIPANKGLVIRTKLDELGLEAADAIFCDDSWGNIVSSVVGDGTGLSAETLYVQPREGLSDEALEYLESRASADSIEPTDDGESEPSGSDTSSVSLPETGLFFSLMFGF